MNKVLCFLVGAVICLFILSKCDRCTSPGYPTYQVDTVYIQVTDSGSFQPKEDSIAPGKIPGGDSIEVKKPQINGTDTFWIYEKIWMPIDTMAILHDYFAKRFYGDTIDIKYGKLYLWDTVSKNRITGTGWRLEQNIPEVTITKTPPKKIKGYLTGSIQGTLSDPLQGFAPGFMLQFKNDDAIEFQKWFFKSPFPEPTYQLSYKFKLSLKK